MATTNYTELTEKVKYYLGLYPHVGVALEATLEDIDGSGPIVLEAKSAMDRINAGENDVVVLTDWADKVVAISLGKLATEISEARAKGEDIGLYVNRHAIREAQQQKRRKSFNKNRRPRR